MTDNADPQAQLVAAQLRHTVDLLKADNERLRTMLEHQKEIYDHRLKEAETCISDHESRIRTLQDSATQFKVLAGLATGGGLLSVITLVQLLTRIP